ncbi:MAG TPA: IPT/TIG domain-containing protein [Bryobacteraceae bacterium]|nr:IPT/TIG domain-containing protein [Bryobacteraceae bacterium]
MIGPRILCCLILCSIAGAADLTPPSIASASPNRIDAGGPYFLITVDGSGFIAGAVVSWGRTPLNTTFVSATELKAAITPDLRALSSTFNLTVANPFGLVSNAYPVIVSPVLASITPASVVTGSPPVTITAKGIGLIIRDVLTFSAAGQQTTFIPTFVDSSTLTVVIPADALAVAKTATIQVFDPLDGDTSGSLPFSIRAAPTITSASPSPVDAGGAYFLMTLTGTGFTAGSIAKWPGGAQLGTTVVGSTQIQVAITPELRSLSGTFNLTVTDATGAASNPYPITISPVLFTISPAAAVVASPVVTITAAGAGFTRADVLVFNAAGQQSALTTAYVSSTTLTATIPAAVLQTAGAASVLVIDSAGVGHSLTQPFMISPPVPTIASLSPSAVTAGAASFTLTISGANFAAGTIVQWNGSPLSTAVVSATQLNASVSATLVQTMGSAAITVTSSGGAVSNSLNFVINPPPPTITALLPSSATAGSSLLILTVNGTNCAGVVVRWNGSQLATTFMSATQVTAAVPANLISSSGTATITLVNQNGASSNPAQFTIYPQAPILTSLSPNAAMSGVPTFILTINGINFVPGATALWNGAPLSTAFVSGTQITATVLASLSSSVLSVPVTVSSPGGAVSNSLTFTINPPRPTVAALSPPSASAGAASFTLTVNGLNFAISCVLRWNGVALSTTFVSATQVTASVPASLVAVAGPAAVTVTNPSGLASDAATFFITVAAPIVSQPLPSISSAGIVNLASLTPSIAPGSLISINGVNLAFGDATASSMPLPISLNGTSITINGIAAPLAFASSTQISAQVPFETKVGTATLLIQVGTVPSLPVTFEVTAAAPGVLTTPQSIHAVTQNYPDGTLNSPENPARPGQYVAVYLTGQGLVDHPVATGAAAPTSPLSLPLAPVLVQVGGKVADIGFAGLAPGFVGLMQLDIVIPEVDAGEQPLDVSIGGVAANRTVLSVKTDQ